MPAMTNILVKDDASTPVEYTLLPVSDSGGVATWRGNVPTVPLEGQMRLTMFVEKLKRGSRAVIKTEVPVMETLGASGTSGGYVAPPKVAYVNTAITTFFVDPRSTGADRANLLKLHLGVAQGASSTTATGVLANTAAGNAFLNSVLPGPQLLKDLFVPN